MPAPFDVIAEPTRRRILDHLRRGASSVGELADALQLSQPAASKHLRVLRDTGFVDVRRDGQRRWYELRTEPLAEIDAWLTPYRWMWEHRVDRLERVLDAMPAVPADASAGSAPEEPSP